MIRISKNSAQRLERTVRSYRDRGLVRDFCDAAGIEELVLTPRQRRILRERGWTGHQIAPHQQK